jgi:hypothetical protein
MIKTSTSADLARNLIRHRAAIAEIGDALAAAHEEVPFTVDFPCDGSGGSLFPS